MAPVRDRLPRWRSVRAAWARRAPRTKAMLVLTLAVLALNVPMVLVNTRVSAIDEQFHIDDLVKISQLGLNQSGDYLDRETVVELCERGHQYPDVVPYSTCSHSRNPRDYGVNPLESLPPYYFVTGLAARALRALPVDLPPRDSMVTWARLLGSAWLLLGCWFALRAGELLGLRRRYVTIGLIAAISVPTVIHASTTVNTDATAFAAGAGMLWAVLAWERGRCRLWVPVVAAFAAAAMKLPNTVGVAVVLVYLAARLIQTRVGTRDSEARSPLSYLGAIGGIGVGAVAALRGLDQVWRVIRHDLMGFADTYAGDHPVFARYAVDEFPTDRFFSLRTLRAFLPPVPDISPPEERAGMFYLQLWRVMRVLFLAPLVLVPLLIRRIWDRLVLLNIATVAACVAMPGAFLLYWYFASGTSDRIVARYGISALAAMVLLLASVIGRVRFAPWVVGSAAGLVYLVGVMSNVV